MRLEVIKQADGSRRTYLNGEDITQHVGEMVITIKPWHPVEIVATYLETRDSETRRSTVVRRLTDR